MRRMISMDYGIEVPSYRRVDSEKEKKKLNFENGIFGMLLTIASGAMLSRVGFGFVEGLYLAPFGRQARSRYAYRARR